MSKKIKVKTEKGTTTGNWEYYAAADKRIKAIRDRFREGNVDEVQVETAVTKICGWYRHDQDWAVATEGISGDRPKIEAYDAWLAKQPPEYSRIYGHPQVITAFIVNEEE